MRNFVRKLQKITYIFGLCAATGPKQSKMSRILGEGVVCVTKDMSANGNALACQLQRVERAVHGVYLISLMKY